MDVHDAAGSWIARGLYNPHSQIRARLYTWEDEPLDGAFFARRLRGAVALRRDLLDLTDPAGACRLVFSEGDGLSGLTVDRYRDALVVQLTSLALDRFREELLDALCDLVTPSVVVLRTEKGILDEEGLRITDGILRGQAPEAPIEISEGPVRFEVDARTGQKTGFYLDQRDNRGRVAAHAAGRSVADVCSYTGGFGVRAAAAGARRVTCVDVSAAALDLARRNAELNGLELEVVRADAFGWLGAESEAGRRYGMVVLDPPRFARTRRGVPDALNAYRRLNGLALTCVEPGGLLVTFSCSGRVPEADFAGALGRAAADSGRRVRILERLAQAPDHPVAATCPEGAYLKGFLCSVE